MSNDNAVQFAAEASRATPKPTSNRDMTRGERPPSRMSAKRPTSKAAKPTSKPPPVETDASFLDPTWFFPVGEAVLHRNLGPGVVLGHSGTEQPDEAKVRVEFENGQVLEFPALGSDIVPNLGR